MIVSNLRRGSLRTGGAPTEGGGVVHVAWRGDNYDSSQQRGFQQRVQRYLVVALVRLGRNTGERSPPLASGLISCGRHSVPSAGRLVVLLLYGAGKLVAF
jgi:hypothetical protein